MALQKSYKLNVYGQTLNFDNAYFKITNLNGDKNNIYIQVSIFTDNTKNNFIDKHDYGFVPSVITGASNFIQQGYEYLKTLEEFTGAVDLLDEGQTA